MPSEEQTKQIADNVALVLKTGLCDPRKSYTDVIEDVHEAVLKEVFALNRSPSSPMSFLSKSPNGEPVLHDLRLLPSANDQ